MASNFDDVVARSERAYREGVQCLARMPEVSSLAGKQIVIAGCTGLIGTALTSVLLTANAVGSVTAPIHVCGVARSDSSPFQDAPWFTYVKASVTDDLLDSLLPSCDYVVYVAGTTSEYAARPRETILTQTVGLERFLSRAERCSGFVYVSSTRVYGRLDSDVPIHEDQVAQVAPMHLDNLYDSSKRLGESLCLWFARQQGRPVTVVRMTNLYGPYASSQSRTVVVDFVQQALSRRRIELWGHPESIRNYCSALDAAQGTLKALVTGRAGRAYNIGSHEHLATRRLAEMVSAALPFSADVSWSAEHASPSVQRIAIQRAIAELGYQPAHCFEALAPFVVAHTANALGHPVTS